MEQIINNQILTNLEDHKYGLIRKQRAVVLLAYQNICLYHIYLYILDRNRKLIPKNHLKKSVQDSWQKYTSCI